MNISVNDDAIFSCSNLNNITRIGRMDIKTGKEKFIDLKGCIVSILKATKRRCIFLITMMQHVI